jgi:CoA:oxalate CoA-transferase
MTESALKGIRVVENSVHLAGPYCGRLLAELGAEVIKVEPPTGEANRRSPPLVNGEALLYLYYNSMKKGLALDLKQEKGREVFRDLISRSDVFLCNYRPGAMEKLGLGYSELKRVNERLIYVSVTGFGYTGPLSQMAGYDPLAQAVSGLMDANGCEDGLPKVNAMSLDYSTSMMAACVTVSALFYRERTGKGQFIDMSLHDSGVIFSVPWMGFQISGMRYRHGNKSRVFAPYNMYQARDGHVMVAINEDSRWKAFLSSIGQGAVVDDPRFRSVADRVKNYDDIDAIISQWSKDLTVKEVMEVVIAAGGASAPVRTIVEAQSEPHSYSREMLIEMEHPRVGKLKIAGSGFKMSETPGRVTGRAPALGEHNEEVLSGILGYPRSMIEQLRKSGVIAGGAT